MVPPENLREHVRVLPQLVYAVYVDAVVFGQQSLERRLSSGHRRIGNCIRCILSDIEGSRDVGENVGFAVPCYWMHFTPFLYSGVEEGIIHYCGGVRLDTIPEGAFLGKNGGFVDGVGLERHADLLEIYDV